MYFLLEKGRYILKEGALYMINIVYSELLKLKKSNITFPVLVGALTLPLFLDVLFLLKEYQSLDFQDYVYRTEGNSFLLLYPIIFAVIAGKIFAREYSDKTYSNLFCYPYGRTKIFLGKLLVIYIIMIVTCILQSAYVYITYYLLEGSIDISLIIQDIKNIFIALLFQMALIPIPIFLANIKKGIVFPIIYGVLTEVISLNMNDPDFTFNKFNPLLVSKFFIFHSYRGENFDLFIASAVSIVCFVIFMAIAIYQYKKADMV